MTQLSSLLLFKAVLLSGLALWLCVVVLNNLTAFRGGVFSVGSLMAMQLFDEAPPIRSPLLSRRVTAEGWHRLIYGFIVALEVAVALLLVYAAMASLGAFLGYADTRFAVARANLALSGFVAMGLTMLVGGAWFAYYIRQEGTQITHLALIGLGVVAGIIINMPAG
ncbi:MAG: DUF2165 domain-containing protein [Rhizobium sp.]|nr:DUF2165 domain-containing protein [Rhizobium sp.]